MISALLGAVFGSQGQSQDIIPQTMRLGEVSSKWKIICILMRASVRR